MSFIEKLLRRKGISSESPIGKSIASAIEDRNWNKLPPTIAKEAQELVEERPDLRDVARMPLPAAAPAPDLSEAPAGPDLTDVADARLDELPTIAATGPAPAVAEITDAQEAGNAEVEAAEVRLEIEATPTEDIDTDPAISAASGDAVPTAAASAVDPLAGAQFTRLADRMAGNALPDDEAPVTVATAEPDAPVLGTDIDPGTGASPPLPPPIAAALSEAEPDLTPIADIAPTDDEAPLAAARQRLAPNLEPAPRSLPPHDGAAVSSLGSVHPDRVAQTILRLLEEARAEGGHNALYPLADSPTARQLSGALETLKPFLVPGHPMLEQVEALMEARAACDLMEVRIYRGLFNMQASLTRAMGQFEGCISPHLVPAITRDLENERLLQRDAAE